MNDSTYAFWFGLPGSVESGWSTTALPSCLTIGGGSSVWRFGNDGSLQGCCSVFNFNPFNYYQTPLEHLGDTFFTLLSHPLLSVPARSAGISFLARLSARTLVGCSR